MAQDENLKEKLNLILTQRKTLEDFKTLDRTIAPTIQNTNDRFLMSGYLSNDQFATEPALCTINASTNKIVVEVTSSGEIGRASFR